MLSGWAPRAAWAGAAVVTSVLAQVESAADEPRATSEGILECVSYGQTTHDTGVKFRLESACEEALSCRISWTVRCGGGRERNEGAVFSLAPGAKRAVRASARACRDEGWVIEDVTWTCRTP